MNNEKEKNIILIIFISSVVLLAVIIGVILADSPKFDFEKEYVSAFSAGNIEINELTSSESSAEGEDDSVFPIAINFATSELLEEIPNIGPVTAKLIIDYRNEYGTITDFDELLSVDGIGEKTVELLKEYCVIN